MAPVPMPLRNPGFLPRHAFQALFDALHRRGWRVLGPAVGERVVHFAELASAADLQSGLGDVQSPGRYRLGLSDGPRWFDWTVGPDGLKPLVFPPREVLWRAAPAADGRLHFTAEPPDAPRLAVLGARACDLAGLALLDRHFLGDVAFDPGYAARRAALFLIGVDCNRSGATCFCASTGDGPALADGYDLGLAELDDGFLAWPGTAAGEAVVADLPLTEASPTHLGAAAEATRGAAAAQRRALPSRRLASALYGAMHHDRWAAVAARCLGCGNCAMVCPTCFCHGHCTEDGAGAGEAIQVREWDTCFDPAHSRLHGASVRDGVAVRYRQWVTHKLAGWHAQFGRSGCVGCGRCVTWCPAAIDLTAEVAAIVGETGDD
ncbi:MAG: 4Fe-4S dicluster domain-containing protein [Gammaproteobacteria bacterium]|nr:4Fe-4S dicluster domain-containing protein [Gammaproteobacteria bacterium]